MGQKSHSRTGTIVFKKKILGLISLFPRRTSYFDSKFFFLNAIYRDRDMSYSFWLDESSSKRRTFDVIIVGSGIAGASVAYWLTKEDPSLEISVLERGSLVSGATGRNAGFITCGSVEHFNRLVARHGREKAAKIWRFSESNLQNLKEEIIQGDGESIDFQHNGSFSLASTETEFYELKETAKLMEVSPLMWRWLEKVKLKKGLAL